MPDDLGNNPPHHHHHFSGAVLMNDANHITRLIMLYRNLEFIAWKLAPHVKRCIEDFKKGYNEELRRQEEARRK